MFPWISLTFLIVSFKFIGMLSILLKTSFLSLRYCMLVMSSFAHALNNWLVCNVLSLYFYKHHKVLTNRIQFY